jgi:catechol 2,3-dioxygenase-like lactoylglutathione lyase family enzyme
MKQFIAIILTAVLLSTSAIAAAAGAAGAAKADAPVLSVVAIHHVSIAVPDLDAAIAWYSKIFGLTIEHRMETNFGMRGAFLRRPGIRLELWQSQSLPDTPEARRAPKQDMKIMGIKHVAFVVPDLRSALAALLKQGVQLIAVQYDRNEPMQPDPDPLAPGKRRPFSIFIADPFGTPIEILDGAQVGNGV